MVKRLGNSTVCARNLGFNFHPFSEQAPVGMAAVDAENYLDDSGAFSRKGAAYGFEQFRENFFLFFGGIFVNLKSVSFLPSHIKKGEERREQSGEQRESLKASERRK
jgi:hypothetical protein